MTLKNKKTVLFASIIAAVILPVSAMGIINASEDETIPDKVADRVVQIQKPVETQAEKNDFKQVEKLLDENIKLTDEAEVLETSSQDGIPLTQSETVQLDKIKERLSEISTEFGVLQTTSQKLYAITLEDKKQLLDAKKLLRSLDIPYTGLGTDTKVGALEIGFETQQIADTYIPIIEQTISVPYYIEIYPVPEFDACRTQNSNCDPLMGGVKITTQYNSTTVNYCTYSIPATRNLPFWQSEEGFVTAGHCFESQNGNDVRQPIHTSSKIGDLTKRVVGGECDCAFVKKTGSESTLFGTWNGINKSNQLLSKSDPLKGSYVILIGAKSGMNIAKVTDDSFDVLSNPSIDNTIKVNYDTSKGDSGGSVIDFNTRNVYHGLISSSGSGSAHVIPWSHIDAGLDLK